MFPLKPLCLGLIALIGACGPILANPPDGKIHLSYWEKWSGEEENAMQQVVDQFNHSQDRIVIDFLSVGDIEQKTLLAIAGGDPPDIAGIYVGNITLFADRDALVPLDNFIRADGTTPEQFLSRYAPAYAGMGSYEGKTWAVPSTPTTHAFYWNKDLFRAAGLDPEKPPRTLAELDAMSEKLTVRDAVGHLKQVGFLPQTAYNMSWAGPLWFGGQIFDGKNITIGTNPINLKAYQWMAHYSQEYGVDNIRRLASSFGSLASPDDPFMSGQVAIIIDGSWRYNYIQQFAPGMNYGVAPWPEAQPGITDFTVAESDMLVIPRGAKHPREAWEFLKYLSSPNLSAQRFEDLRGMELLCYLQKKPSALEQWSPFFASHHPNPDIQVFRQLAESRHAVHVPEMGISEEYQRELSTAFDEVRLGLESPEEALQQCQARMQDSWVWHQESLALRKKPIAQTQPPPTPPSPP